MAALDLLDLDEAKQAINLTGTTEHDAEIPGWVTAVSLRLDDLVGPVVARAVTDKLSGGVPRVFLSKYPVKSITSVTEYAGTTATTLQAESNTSKPADGYLVHPYSMDPALLGNSLHRRSSGRDAVFPQGIGNIEVTYSAGRFTNTDSVDERFKKAAALTLLNLWRSQQQSTQQFNEYDVPLNSFPRFDVPGSAKGLLHGEVQNSTLVVL